MGNQPVSQAGEFSAFPKPDSKVQTSPATIALFQSTWAAAALPSRSATNLFVPRGAYQQHLSKMVGLAESFGLPYELITERDLLSPAKATAFSSHHYSDVGPDAAGARGKGVYETLPGFASGSDTIKV